MAKELPYFKFEPAEYLTKDISFCSLEAQGLFINICSYYWQRECQLTKKQIIKRFNYPEILKELIDEKIIKCDEDENITISFLYIQFNEIEDKKNNDSEKGKIGNLKRWHKDIYNKFINKEISLNEALVIAKTSGSDTLAIAKTSQIREDKIREDKIKEDDIEKENIYNDIEILKLHYLSKDKVLNAVINNKENKTKSIEDLKIKLDLFCLDLIEQGRLALTWKEFTSYFRNCLKFGKFDEAKSKIIENPNNEEIIRFNSNVNPTIFELPKSKFLEMQENNKAGGYIYNIIQ